MELVNLSCSDFAEKLAGKDPVPGGGGASALAGALGVCLGNMVGALTVGKKNMRMSSGRCMTSADRRRCSAWSSWRW